MECLDYHKDRDCHWYIQQIWSYGNEPYWEAQHYGYVFDGGQIKCTSYENALDKLIKLIKRGFKDEVEQAEFVLNNKKDWDEYDIEHAEKIIKRMKPEI